MYDDTAYQIYHEMVHPFWNVLKEAKIVSCKSGRESCQWYKDMIGETIKIKHFGTFGVWDDQRRWLDFYDLKLL